MVIYLISKSILFMHWTFQDALVMSMVVTVYQQAK